MTDIYWHLWNIFKFRWISHLLRIVWVLANNLYCIPVQFVILVFCFPIYLISPDTYNALEETLYTWLLSMVSCWIWSCDYNILESGDKLDNIVKENILIMPNHQSTADVPVMMTLFTPRIGFGGKVMWIMDKVFKFTNFGVISWFHDDFFILAGKATREKSLDELRIHLTEAFVKKKRKYLVLFPEGGFLRKRKEVSQSFAKKKDLPLLELCTIPRTGALDVIMSILGPDGTSPEYSHISKVVDVTIAYPEGKPLDLQSIITAWRPPCTTHVHYRVFDIKDLPKDSEEIFSWMVNLYQEKEKMLETFYTTGQFPYSMYSNEASPPTRLHHSPTRYLAIHIFYITVNIIVCCLLSSLYYFVRSLLH